MIQEWQFRRMPAGMTIIQSFPRSGSTWIRSMVASALEGEVLSIDDLRDTVPPLPGSDPIRRRPSSPTRIFRTHERLMTKPRAGIRIAQVVRNPVEVLPSYYEHSVAAHLYSGTQAHFIDSATDGSLADGYGTWAENVSSWAAWPELRVMRYEDFVTDTHAALGELLEWSGWTLPDDRIAFAVETNGRSSMASRAKTADRHRGYDGDFVGAVPRSERQTISDAQAKLIVDSFGSVMTQVQLP